MPHRSIQSLLRASTLVLLSLLLQAQTTVPTEDTHRAPAPHHSETIADLITDLRSNTFAIRENATAILLHLPAENRTEIESALANGQDEEAIARLTKIATHLYLKELTPLYGKTPLLGMVFGVEVVQLNAADTEKHASIAVKYLHPGFPAAEVLKSGDRLIAINGTFFPSEMVTEDPLTAAENFRAIVATGHPGNYMNFTVIRSGHELQLSVQLAGIPESAMSNLTNYIEQRTVLATDFANGLKTGRTSEPIVWGVGSPENP